jgi:hypothetical protein
MVFVVLVWHLVHSCKLVIVCLRFQSISLYLLLYDADERDLMLLHVGTCDSSNRASGLFNLFTSGRWGFPDIPGMPFYVGGLVAVFAVLLGLSVPAASPRSAITAAAPTTSSNDHENSTSQTRSVNSPDGSAASVHNQQNGSNREPLLRSVVSSSD